MPQRHALKRLQEGVHFWLAAIQLLGQMPSSGVVMARERESIDDASLHPLGAAGFKILSQAIGTLIALLRVLGQLFGNDRRHHARHVRMNRLDLCGRHGQVRMHDFQGIVALEGQGPGQHLIERHPQGIHIRAGIDLLVHAPGLLRCHIRQGPFESVQVTYLLRFPRELGGSAEIDEFRRQRFSVDRDIAGIDVFMHDTSTLHGLQPPCQLYGDMQKGSQFKPVLRNQVHQGHGIEVF